MHPLARLDHRYVWHPFTQMRDWLSSEPIVIVRGRGATLTDAHGNRYLDANASIWTNLHGHNHPLLNAALRTQLRRIAHSSALGLANEPASLLAEQLVRIARLPATPHSGLRNPHLSKVFYSDDGSTAVEVALKLAYEFSRRSGRCRQPRFLTVDGAYHGDTIGAVSLGHIDLFHRAYAGLLFRTDAVIAPYCYRCPFNRARPERADARQYRCCRWECVDQVEARLATAERRRRPYAAFVVEPRIQGAAGMIAHPEGWLSRVATLVRGHQTLLIADEVMTGFGRVGCQGARSVRAAPLFACHGEGVQPDFLCLAKGLAGGYLPLAATLTTPEVFAAFLGEYSDFKTFFHGHSFTANQLGTAVARANLQLLQTAESLRARRALEAAFSQELLSLWALPQVGDIRQAGLVAGIELVRDWRTREPFDLREQAGIRVCAEMARLGVLTRPIGNVVVLMPPYCTTRSQLHRMVDTLRRAISTIVGGSHRQPRIPSPRSSPQAKR